MEESEEFPEEGPYLKIWIDIPEVGEPIVRYWQGGASEELFPAWLRSLDELDIEVIAVGEPFGSDGCQWVLETKDPSCGGVAYWVRLCEW